MSKRSGELWSKSTDYGSTLKVSLSSPSLWASTPVSCNEIESSDKKTSNSAIRIGECKFRWELDFSKLCELSFFSSELNFFSTELWSKTLLEGDEETGRDAKISWVSLESSRWIVTIPFQAFHLLKIPSHRWDRYRSPVLNKSFLNLEIKSVKRSNSYVLNNLTESSKNVIFNRSLLLKGQLKDWFKEGGSMMLWYKKKMGSADSLSCMKMRRNARRDKLDWSKPCLTIIVHLDLTLQQPNPRIKGSFLR
jgi:hypothetical protein